MAKTDLLYIVLLLAIPAVCYAVAFMHGQTVEPDPELTKTHAIIAGILTTIVTAMMITYAFWVVEHLAPAITRCREILNG